MCRMHGMTLWIALILVVAGCGKPAGTAPSSTPQGPDTAATAANDRADTAAKAEGPAARRRQVP